MRSLLVTAFVLAATVPSLAAGDRCATVKDGIPDDYLNVREGPGIEYDIIERIYPGDAVSLSDARCGLDTFGVTLCTGVMSDWRYLQGRFDSAGTASEYSGWVNSIYLDTAPCP